MIDFLIKNDKKYIDRLNFKILLLFMHSLMTPNKREFLNYINVTNFDDRAIELGFECIKKRKIKYLLITLGRKGMVLLNDNNKKTLIKANADEVFDVSGAGDTVIASLAFALLIQQVSLMLLNSVI